MTKDIDQETGLGKVCTKCGEWKLLNCFYTRKDRGVQRLHAECKQCIIQRSISYDKEHKAEVAERRAVWREENRIRINEAKDNWRRSNPEKVRASQYGWNEKNPDKIKEINRRRREKISNIPKNKVTTAVSRRIRSTISKGGKFGKSTFDILGYSAAELMAHLESLFLPGMDWDNYGRWGWHIDHIIPVSAFNYETTADIDFKRCWALSNLQPLWAFDNLSKKDKLLSEFQPSLAF